MIARASFRNFVLPLLCVPVLIALAQCRTISPPLAHQVVAPHEVQGNLASIRPFLHYYEGVVSRIYGHYTNSIFHLNMARSLDSTQAPVFFELALNYTALNQVDSAVYFLKRAVHLDSVNYYYLSLLSSLQMERNDFEDLLTTYRRLIAIAPDETYYQLQYAFVLAHLQRFDDAIPIAKALNARYGFLSHANDLLYRIHLQRNDLDSALHYLELLISHHPTELEYLLRSAEIYYSMGSYELGYQLVEKALGYNPTNPDAQLQYFRMRAMRGQTAKSLAALRPVFSNVDISLASKFEIFSSLLLLTSYYDSFPKQIDSLVSIISDLYPHQDLAHIIRYEHSRRVGDLPAARVHLDSILDFKRHLPSVWQESLSLDYTLEKYPRMLITSREAIDRFPNEYIFYLFKSIAHQQLNNPSEALRSLRSGLRPNRDNPEVLSEIYGALGDLYYTKGSVSRSFRAYRRSISHNPNNARILNNYSYYLSLQRKDLDKALAMSTQAVSMEPNNSSFLDTKGWVLFNLSRYQEARDMLRLALANNGSSNGIILEHYGDALYKTNNTEGAYVYWQKALQAGGGSDRLEEKIRLRRWVQ